MSSATSLSSSPRSDWTLDLAERFDPDDDSDATLALECAGSLRMMVRTAWPIVEPATPYVPGWHIDVICEHLEAVSAGEIRRLLVNQPPRTMKSLTVGVFWPAWEWLTRPHLRWLFASYAANLAIRDSVKCRRLIQSMGGRRDGGLFQRVGYQGVLGLLGQDWTLMGDQNAKEKYETSATGLRLATSVGGVATGEGGDRIVVDDPTNAEQARSDVEREGANTWWDETMTTRFNNAQASAVIVMQRLHEQDLTGHLVEQGGWHHLCLPAEYEPKHPFVYPDKVKVGTRVLAGDPRTEPGELLEPVRLSPERLAELKRGLGSYGYAGQLQQRPAPMEGGILPTAWWRYYNPDWLSTIEDGWQGPHFTRLVQSWDTAGKEKTSSDFTVGQLWGWFGSHAYLLRSVRGRWGLVDCKQQMRDLTAWQQQHFPGLPCPIKVENAANGPELIAALRVELPGIRPVQASVDKVTRALAISPQLEAGQVHVPGYALDSGMGPDPARTPAWAQELIMECAVFNNGSHDDQVDALTQALDPRDHGPGGRIRGGGGTTVGSRKP